MGLPALRYRWGRLEAKCGTVLQYAQDLRRAELSAECIHVATQNVRPCVHYIPTRHGLCVSRSSEVFLHVPLSKPRPSVPPRGPMPQLESSRMHEFGPVTGQLAGPKVIFFFEVRSSALSLCVLGAKKKKSVKKIPLLR